MLKRRRAYFAAPLFTPTERDFNERLSRRLSRSFDVFLPQRDGILLVSKGCGVEQQRSLRSDVFATDVEAIHRADLLFAVLDGRTIDEGVAFELGVAFAQGKPCVGFRSDSRVLIPSGINPMIEHACSVLLSSEIELEEWLQACPV
jgi:nucleoside 2-deoxyribosyltransferase